MKLRNTFFLQCGAYTPASKLGGQWGVPQLIEFFNGLVNNARASFLPLLQKQ
jgi:hypothetical protein